MFQRKVDALNAASNDTGSKKKPTTSMMQWEWLKTAKEKWSAKDTAGKKMVLYIAILLIGWVITAWKGYLWGGGITVVLVHIMWWRYSDKPTLFTKVVVYSMLGLLFIGLISPRAADQLKNAGWTSVKKALKDAGTGAEKLSAQYEKDELFKSSPAKKGSAGSAKEWSVTKTVTNERFTEIRIPSGVSFAIDCPENGVARVYHRGAPSEGIDYLCADGPVEPGENLHNFQIGFASVDANPAKVTIWFKRM